MLEKTWVPGPAAVAATRDDPDRRVAGGAEDAGPVLSHRRPTGVQLYRRGPLLLRELELRIGTQRMDQLLARIARETPTDTQQFLEVLAEVAGNSAADVRPGKWVRHPHPAMVEREALDEKEILEVTGLPPAPPLVEAAQEG